MTSSLGIGFLLGLMIAAPVGPMALWSIRTTLERGLQAGLAAALGAASADAIFGLTAGWGVSLLLEFLRDHHSLFRFFGGSLLVFYGLRGLRSPSPAHPPGPSEPKEGIPRDNRWATDFWRRWLSGFVITGSSPLTILAFCAVLAQAKNAGPPYLTALGVLAGSFSWYAGLSGVTLLLRERLANKMTLIKRITALAFAATGLALMVLAIWGML